MYTCPMHPKVRQDQPGSCPVCGMKLVLEQDVEGSHMMQREPADTENSYAPLIVIVTLIALTSIAITRAGDATFKDFVENFMIGFFVTFAGFKLMDLKGFAEGYSTYDLLAKQVSGYGYVYPFIELGFAWGMILWPGSRGLLMAEVAVMGFSGLGVLFKLLKKEKFQCACLGTFLKVPLTYVTLVEDFGMAVLGLVLLLL